MPRHAPPVNLSEMDRQELERWVAAHRTPQQVSQRCQIVLAAAQGQQDKVIADDLDLNFETVTLWRKRFISEGADCPTTSATGRLRGLPRWKSRKVRSSANAMGAIAIKRS